MPEQMPHNTEQAPRILLVDDDPDQRDLMCEALGMYYDQRPGGCVHADATVAECLRRDLDDYDILLLDYNLPDGTGVELLEQIRERSDVPVVFVTGQNDSTVAAEAVKRGAEDYVVKLGDYLFALPILLEKAVRQHRTRKENRILQQRLEEALGQLKVKNQQLEESLIKLQALATTDHLTGLANRRRFGEVLERSFDEAVRYEFDLTCCMCDLDHYKELNDTLGHQFGDEVLVVASEIIRSSLRSTDIAARYGGDEFVLLLPHTPIDRGVEVGQRIRTELADACRRYEGVTNPVTMSVGVASLQADEPASAEQLISLADECLYAAKEQGKDRICSRRGGHSAPRCEPA